MRRKKAVLESNRCRRSDSMGVATRPAESRSPCSRAAGASGAVPGPVRTSVEALCAWAPNSARTPRSPITTGYVVELAPEPG
ncbi:hypothetical protein [Streptomyces sp. NPDC085529]|uniref:hypothetical protein n=1 Tax=Streptomyces sp. NPDC085529 TaxID=3365729 RepID=UPI0037D87CAB